ncbi:TPA: formyl peptide receptor-like 1 inhibitory protein [Staphylococcus aureus]|nr:formyl peptide receptor-like 1 inhibitory protein [Staphylococcus aureus]
MKKNITKVIIASTVIATGLLTHSNDAKAFFSYEWKGLEIAKKLGKGNTIAVVRIIDGGKNGYYTFDITRPLEEHRKNIPVVKNGEIDSITWY